MTLETETTLVRMVDALAAAPTTTPLDRVIAYCRAGIAAEAIVALDERAMAAARLKRRLFKADTPPHIEAAE